jgi:hypothetical protein
MQDATERVQHREAVVGESRWKEQKRIINPDGNKKSMFGAKLSAGSGTMVGLRSARHCSFSKTLPFDTEF